jgi:3-oxoacyl-[acyl-carrier protein] reductase
VDDILDLSGKVALITGAGQGVGRQVALHFAEHGAAGVAVNDYVPERAQLVVDEIAALGARAIAVPGDVTDLTAVKAMVQTAEQAFGPVDILVNNAGNAGANPDPDARKPFWETGPEAWNSFLGVNLYGVINCASACIPQMIDRKGGRIITIISDAGRMGEAGLEVYSGAKAGAAGFTRAIARSLGRYGITANCIAIAATMTPAIEGRLKANPDVLKKMMEKYVIRRPGQPGDVANMALFLASGASTWITGQTYPVNGGFSFAM